MRLVIATAAALALGACQVSKDDANDSVSVTYNEDIAEDAVADIGNTAENVAEDIGNDIEREGDKIENRVDGADNSPPPAATDDNQ